MAHHIGAPMPETYLRGLLCGGRLPECYKLARDSTAQTYTGSHRWRSVHSGIIRLCRWDVNVLHTDCATPALILIEYPGQSLCNPRAGFIR